MKKIYVEGFFSIPSDKDPDQFLNELYDWLESRGGWFSGWIEAIDPAKGSGGCGGLQEKET